MGNYSSDKHNISQTMATQDKIEQLQAKLAKYKKALADTPSHEDMDAAVFRANYYKDELREVNKRLTEAKKKITRLEDQ
ncbi:hypothetical protein LCGC14_0475950 [marine sediment metagenome]|uniref:Uncharacterized protein n=1 Tax=marine sediment metagenome TaxID=412755 RepID=A0A0F9VJJ2_9ZZZZ